MSHYGFPDKLEHIYKHTFYKEIKLPYSQDAINFMLSSISNFSKPLIIIDLLNHGKVKYDGTVLIPIFERLDKKLKWDFCSLINRNIPLNINEWIINQYLSKENGDETLLLAEVIPMITSKERAIQILKEGFDHKPGITAAVIGKIDKQGITLEFLREKLNIFSDKSKLPYKEIVKSINKIEKRLLKIK